MKALQELISRCNKSDKASMLDEAIEYLKSLQIQVQVFGLYFMQSYIGLLYHAILHRNFATLRRIIIQRLIVSEVLEIIVGNLLPYIKFSYRKYRAVGNKKGMRDRKSGINSRVEKEYLKPKYSASVGDELEDGLFDDVLELALQFGMIMMFACAFPSAFAFAALDEREFDYSKGSGKGPEEWGKLHKEWAACNSGKMQSPIDLSNKRVDVVHKSKKLLRNYKPCTAVIINRSHDIEVQKLKQLVESQDRERAREEEMKIMQEQLAFLTKAWKDNFSPPPN